MFDRLLQLANNQCLNQIFLNAFFELRLLQGVLFDAPSNNTRQLFLSNKKFKYLLQSSRIVPAYLVFHFFFTFYIQKGKGIVVKVHLSHSGQVSGLSIERNLMKIMLV